MVIILYKAMTRKITLEIEVEITGSKNKELIQEALQNYTIETGLSIPLEHQTFSESGFSSVTITLKKVEEIEKYGKNYKEKNKKNQTR